MKELRCKDAGKDCNFVARGQTEEEVLKSAAEHGKTAHNMTDIPHEMMTKMRSLIHEITDK